MADRARGPRRAQTRRAVVLARGAGRRMQAPDEAAALTPAQREAAASGHKAMMPIGDRPFLDYVLDALANAGVRDVALVVAPDHEGVRAAYEGARTPARLTLAWIPQPEPRGTADAVRVAEAWAGADPFLALNGDNLYPEAAISALAALDGPGLAVFDRDELVASSNIPANRVAAFALVEVDDAGRLLSITEKPDPAQVAHSGEHQLVSMNLWRFDRRIFAACRDVAASSRGEFELPSAALLACSRGVEFQAVRARGPVLDLSQQVDVAEITRRLAHPVPRL